MSLIYKVRYLLVTMFVSRFVFHINGNQTKITVTISPTDGRIVGKHILADTVQTFCRNIMSTWHRHIAQITKKPFAIFLEDRVQYFIISLCVYRIK